MILNYFDSKKENNIIIYNRNNDKEYRDNKIVKHIITIIINKKIYH